METIHDPLYRVEFKLISSKYEFDDLSALVRIGKAIDIAQEQFCTNGLVKGDEPIFIITRDGRLVRQTHYRQKRELLSANMPTTTLTLDVHVNTLRLLEIYHGTPRKAAKGWQLECSSGDQKFVIVEQYSGETNAEHDFANFRIKNIPI